MQAGGKSLSLQISSNFYGYHTLNKRALPIMTGLRLIALQGWYRDTGKIKPQNDTYKSFSKLCFMQNP